jgi:hypothetical protein
MIERLLEKRGIWIAANALVVLAGSILRLGYLLVPRIDSDQAIFGLQALHVLKGEFPLFQWGYAYLGTLQTYIDAAFFALFGPSRELLNFVPFLFWLGYLGAIWVLARTLFTQRLHRLLALALASISPWFFTVHGIVGRHGYAETFCFGTVMLAMICSGALRRPGRGHFLLLFLVAGVAWWSNFLIAFYLVPVAAYALDRIVRAPAWKERSLIAAESVAGFAVGSAPFWIYNITHDFESLSMFTSETLPRDFGKVIEITVRDVFPVLFGARIWASDLAVPGLWLALTIFWTGATLFVALRYAWPTVSAIRSRGFDPKGLVWLCLVSLFGIYLGTHFASDNNPYSIRYLIPFYTLYPLIPGLFVLGLPERMRRGWFPWLALFLVGMLVANNLLGSPLVHPSERKAYRAEMAVQEGIIASLEQTGKRMFLMDDYWKAPLWTFDAGERLIVADPNTRYPRYVAEMLREGSLNYLVAPKPPMALISGLAALGYTYTSTPVAHLAMLSDFRRATGGPIRAVPGGIVGVISGAAGEKRLAADGNIRTSYDFRVGDKPETVVLELDSVRPLRGIAIHLANRYITLSSLAVRDGRTGGVLLTTGRFSPGFTVADQPFVPVMPDHIELFFPTATTDRLALEFAETNVGELHIGEIVLYEDAPLEETGQGEALPSAATEGLAGGEFRVTASLGTFWKAEDLFPGASIGMPMFRGVDLDLLVPNVLFFESSWLDYNRARLDRIGVGYRVCREGEVACLVTRPHPWKRVRMNGKGLFVASDYRRADAFFQEAKEARADRQSAEVAALLERTLFFHPGHFYASFWSNPTTARNAAPTGAVRFRDTLTLREISVGGEAKAGGSVDVTYDWLVNRKAANDFSVFVHFVGEDGEILFQNDHKLDGVDADRTYWEGETIADHQSVKIPPTLGYRGKAGIWVGVWNPEKGKRWEVQTSLPRNGKKVKIGELEIR